MRKYSLIIQGPIISNGITGASYLEYDLNKKKIPKTVEYNCIPNINRILSEFSYLFEHVILSTWESESIEINQIQTSNNFHILKSKDTTQSYINQAHPNGQIGLLKQFSSIQKGAEFLNGLADESYIIKIRTDQFVNLKLLIEEHRSQSEFYRENKISISYFAKNSLADFYFVATPSKILDFCSSILQIPQYKEINLAYTSVHLAIPCAYYFYNEKIDEKLVYKYIFLKRLMPTFQKYNLTFANCKSAYELVEFIDQHFISFSKNIIFDTEWRGEKIIENSVFDDQLVKFNEIEPVTFTPSNLFLFLSSKLYFKQNRSKLFSKFLSLLQLLLIDRFSFYRKLFIQPIQIK